MRKADLMRKNMVESVKNERNILATTSNPFVVRFYYSFQSQYNLYIVMEYVSGGDCFRSDNIPRCEWGILFVPTLARCLRLVCLDAEDVFAASQSSSQHELPGRACRTGLHC
jgi:serine/threonine protein kinase